MKTLRALVAAVALSMGCGDTIHNYYTDDDTEEGTSAGGTGNSGSSGSNVCGDSEVFGKYLWGLSCGFSLHMREDCVVGYASKDDTEYDYSGLDHGSSPLKHALGPWTYSGLQIFIELPDTYNPVGGTESWLDPDFRFRGRGGDEPRGLARAINDYFDREGGYALNPLLGDYCDDNRSNDCMPLGVMPDPFPGGEACQESSFYFYDEY